MQERVNTAPVGLDAVGEMVAEFSILNGPSQVLAKSIRYMHAKYLNVAKHSMLMFLALGVNKSKKIMKLKLEVTIKP